MRKCSILLIFLVFLIVSCGGGNVRYGDASNASGSKQWGPKEIKTTVNTMVNSLYSFLKNDYKKPVLLQVKRFRNRTSDHIDTKLITDEMIENLIRKRITFVDDSMTKEALAEIEKGMTGIVDPDSAIPVGQLKSPNLFLYGDIRENVRTVGGKRIQYLVVQFKVQEVATGIVVWQKRQEFYKTASEGGITF